MGQYGVHGELKVSQKSLGFLNHNAIAIMRCESIFTQFNNIFLSDLCSNVI